MSAEDGRDGHSRQDDEEPGRDGFGPRAPARASSSRSSRPWHRSAAHRGAWARMDNSVLCLSSCAAKPIALASCRACLLPVVGLDMRAVSLEWCPWLSQFYKQWRHSSSFGCSRLALTVCELTGQACGSLAHFFRWRTPCVPDGKTARHLPSHTRHRHCNLYQGRSCKAQAMVRMAHGDAKVPRAEGDHHARTPFKKRCGIPA